MASFKERLCEGMNLRGMKQVDLANRTGLSASRISHYMNGRWEAKQDALYRIARALDVNEAWLMGHDVPIERNHEADLSTDSNVLDMVSVHLGYGANQLLSNFLQLDEEGQNKALAYLNDLLDATKFRKDDNE